MQTDPQVSLADSGLLSFHVGYNGRIVPLLCPKIWKQFIDVSS